MPTKTLKARVAIDGEQEYKKTLAELNKSNQVLNSQLELLREKYKGSEDSMKAVSETSSVLQQKFEIQSEKVVTLRKALERAIETVGENDSRVKDLQIQLNNAEAAEWKVYRAIEQTDQALTDQGSAADIAKNGMVGLGDSLDKIGDKFGLHIPNTVQESLNSFELFSAGAVVKMGIAAAAVSAVVDVTKRLHEMTIEAAANADDLYSKAAEAGFDVETYQRLENAAKQLNFPEINENLEAIISTMDKLGDESIILTESQIKGLQRVNTKYNEWNSTVDDLKMLIASDFAPASEKALDLITAATKTAGEALVDSGLIKNFATLLELTGGLIQTCGEAASRIPDWMNPVKVASKDLEFLNRTLEGTLDLLGLTKKEMVGYNTVGSDVYGASWKSDVQAWVTAGGTIITPDIIDQIDKTTGKPKNNFYLGGIVPGESAYSYGHMSEEDIQALLRRAGHNADGTESWRGGLTWVGERGPELVDLPQRSRIYSAEQSKSIAASFDSRPILAALEKNNLLLNQAVRAISLVPETMQINRRMYGIP